MIHAGFLPFSRNEKQKTQNPVGSEMDKSPRSVSALSASNRLYYDAIHRQRRKEERLKLEIHSARETSNSFRAGTMSHVYLRRRHRLNEDISSRFSDDSSIGKASCYSEDSVEYDLHSDSEKDGFPKAPRSAMMSTRPSTQATPNRQSSFAEEEFRIPTPPLRKHRSVIAWSELFERILHDSFLPS